MRILSFKIQKFRRKLIFYEFLSILNFLQANNNLYPTFTSSSVVNESFMWIDRLEMDGSSLLCSLCLLPRKLAMPRLSVCCMSTYRSIPILSSYLGSIYLSIYLPLSSVSTYLPISPAKKIDTGSVDFQPTFFYIYIKYELLTTYLYMHLSFEVLFDIYI